MQGAFGHYYKTNPVVSFDFAGRGKYDDAIDKTQYSVDNDTDLIEKIRQYLRFKHISIVGHSQGSVPAQNYAIRYPEHLKKMVLISGLHNGHVWQLTQSAFGRI